MLAKLGQRDLAEKALPVIEQLQSGVGARTNLRLRDIRIALGEHERVMTSLESLLAQGGVVGLPNQLRHDPTYDPLRGHPRFQALLKSLPPSSNAKK